MFDQQIREMQVLLEQNESMKRVYVDTMIKYLTELEDKNRKERRIFVNEQSIKLGRVSTVRQGTKVVDMWEEGEAIIKLQTRLREIQLEKEEIEKLKKTNYGAQNLGPGVSQLAVDTFRLLKPSPKVVVQTEDRINTQKQMLNTRVNELIKQREEFEN